MNPPQWDRYSPAPTSTSSLLLNTDDHVICRTLIGCTPVLDASGVVVDPAEVLPFSQLLQVRCSSETG